MPCEYWILPAQNLVVKAYSGRVTAKCVLTMLDELEGDPAYVEGMREFDDLSGVEDLAITATDIAHFADLVSGLRSRRRMPAKKAVFAVEGPSRVGAFGFSKMLENHPSLKVGVFDDLSEAAAFLGVSEHDITLYPSASKSAVN